VPATTVPPTTVPSTTVPAGGLKLSAPASVRIGTPFTVRITGATLPMGRVDLRIGNQSAGSYLIDGSGSVTATVTPWVYATSVTADWVRYENGSPIVVSVSVAVVVTP
jgi:hypothetical protein